MNSALDADEKPTNPESNSVGVTFRKRARSGKTRKRLRQQSTEDVDIEQVKPKLPIIKEHKRERRNWEKLHFIAKTSQEDAAKTSATAERVDVGGDVVRRTKRPFGPLRAPTNLRASVRVDYQPDVCKDYKETGYCGFGDACKFLHDRSDYKAGWQLDRDWATKEKERREKLLRGESQEEDMGKEESNGVDNDGLPFACFICRNDFQNPVMTLCSHYFCEDCILKSMEKQSTCPICKKQLRGTLNPAAKLKARLEQSRG